MIIVVHTVILLQIGLEIALFSTCILTDLLHTVTYIHKLDH